jgi:hypothetical protein
LPLSVKTQGRRQLPVLDTVENGYPIFENLRDASARQTIIINTFEAVNSKAWLHELTTGHPSVKVTRGKIEEAIDERAGLTRRRYQFEIGWTAMPAEREVRSPIYAQTAIDLEPGILIGSVAAIVKPRRLSPTTVRLERGKVEEDWVIVAPQHDSSEPWTIAPETPLPDWLTGEWTRSDGPMSLHLALSKVFSGSKPERCELSLVAGNGEAETLTVVAYPGE